MVTFRPKLRFSLRALLVAVALAMVALFVVDYYPKSEPLPMGGGHVGWYRGLGLAYGPGFFGKRFYLVELPVTEPGDGMTRIYLSRQVNGYFPAEGFYRDGRLRERGRYKVEFIHDCPYPDPHDVESGEFFHPDGTLRAEIKHGTGKQIYWTSEGRKIWELDLEGFKRKRAQLWKPNGEGIADEQRR